MAAPSCNNKKEVVHANDVKDNYMPISCVSTGIGGVSESTCFTGIHTANIILFLSPRGLVISQQPLDKVRPARTSGLSRGGQIMDHLAVVRAQRPATVPR